MRFWLRSLALAAALAGSIGTLAGWAADRPIQTFEQQNPAATISRYLDRQATLLLLRARFDVVRVDEIPEILAADARAMAATGPSTERQEALASDLLAEGNFYLVQLRYLIQSGGAFWPSDRPEDTYVNDALAALRDLQWQLPVVLANGEDPLPLFIRLDEINAWTEGYETMPPELDHFGPRDALVEAARIEAAPVAT